MLDRRQRTLGNYYLEWLILILVIVYVFTSWSHVMKKEIKAQPIVIDKNITYSENDPTNSALIAVNKKLPGEPGYTPETLGQPCSINPESGVVPNLPGAHKQQGCDKETGLVCVQGIVKGGGICLRNVNRPCNAKNECTPLATGGCIYGFCQESGEVINKPCSNDSQCTNGGQFNHVCDPVSRRCRYGIFPRDSGCTSDVQCEYYTTDTDSPTQSACISNKPVISYPATFQTGNFIINDTSTYLVKGDYISIVNDQEGFLGRFLIESVTSGTGNSTVISVEGVTSPLASDNNYTIELGGEEGGICVIKYPLGSKPISIVPGSQDLFPCEGGLKNLQGFCVESSRNNILGSAGQACNTSGLGCQSGLTCTYDEELQDVLGSNLNVTGTGNSQKIGDIFIKDIGKCTNQTAVYGEFCNNSTKGCVGGENGNICLNQVDVDFNIFQYCGRNWDTFEASKLLGCPPNYTFETTNEVCKSDSNNICFSNSDCVSNSCGSIFNLQYYDFKSNEIEDSGFTQPPEVSSTNHRILSTKEFSGTCQAVPAATGYYYKVSDQSSLVLKTVIYLDEDKTNPKIQTITFNDTDIKDADISIFKKSNGDIQANVIYTENYQNYTRREYQLGSDGSINGYFGLGQGANYFIEEITNSGLPGGNSSTIYTLDYGDITGSITSKNIPSATLDNLGSLGSGYKLVSYNSTYRVNYEINYTSTSVESPLQFCSYDIGNDSEYLDVNNGQSLLYTSNSGTVTYVESPIGSVGLENGATYFSNTFFNRTSSIDSVIGEGGYDVNKLLTLSTSDSYSQIPVIFNTFTSSEVKVLSPIVATEVDGGNWTNSPKPTFTYPTKKGINIFTYTLNSSSDSSTSYIINERKELYYDSNEFPLFNVPVQYNYPLGFLLDTDSDFSVEIDENSIILTEKNGVYNQITQMSYELSFDLTKIPYFQDNDTKKVGINRIDYNSTSEKYISYEITNTYSLPRPKIYSNSGYYTGNNIPSSGASIPYQVDRVQKYIFQDSLQQGEINIISNYKDIDTEETQLDRTLSTNYNRINIMNETNLRSFDIQIQTGSGSYKSSIYSGTTPTPNSNATIEDTLAINPINSSLFGYCVPVEINPLYMSNSENPSRNYYINNLPGIYIVNKQDIDVFLKYSSSELVIGLVDPKVIASSKSLDSIVSTITTENKPVVPDSVPTRYIGVTRIISYDIDDSLNEILFLDTNIIMDSSIDGLIPYVFVNNIVPFFMTNSNTEGAMAVPDGSLIATSCISNTEQIKENNDPLFNALTSYNKFILGLGSNGSNIYPVSFYNDEDLTSPDITEVNKYVSDFFIIPSSVTSQLSASTSSSDFGAYNPNFAGFNLLMYYKLSSLPNSYTAFLINNLFTSSFSLQQNLILNSVTRQVLNRYTSFSSTKTGDGFMYVNSIPFYNSFPKNQGTLDKSYKSQYYWSYWISELSKIPVKINKIIFNFNPGNNGNNMFYYVFCEVQNISMILYLSTNFTNNNIIESQPVPILYNQNVITSNSVKNNFFMTPYDKKLHILANTCN